MGGLCVTPAHQIQPRMYHRMWTVNVMQVLNVMVQIHVPLEPVYPVTSTPLRTHRAGVLFARPVKIILKAWKLVTTRMTVSVLLPTMKQVIMYVSLVLLEHLLRFLTPVNARCVKVIISLPLLCPSTPRTIVRTVLCAPTTSTTTRPAQGSQLQIVRIALMILALHTLQIRLIQILALKAVPVTLTFTVCWEVRVMYVNRPRYVMVY